MADQDASEEQPMRSSSMERKRPSDDDEKCERKRRKGAQACLLRDSPVPADGDGPSTSDAPTFGGFHYMSFSDEDYVGAEGVTYDADPLDDLNTISPAQPSVQADDDDASFLRALDELSDCFHGEERQS
ncbi:hypothetical protein Pmani_014664 [Petrolisthes manimaculis]|uniref:Uncharacterized protein n=1 Tax=Petrolisthes manimaculis TaxID=1843537 RepID=A0AAE1U8H0_9EUCA|nr:hypothetical protein Pmani_014664 [Petrolisthes manimaculis]